MAANLSSGAQDIREPNQANCSSEWTCLRSDRSGHFQRTARMGASIGSVKFRISQCQIGARDL
jgi:hypothetical protein